MVLGGGADHRRAANVDVLDAVRVVGAGGDGRLERVKVDRDQVDRADIMRRHRRLVAGVTAPGEQAAVDFRMQRLDPAVHDFGKTRMVGDLDHGHAGLAQGFRRTAGGQDFDAGCGQRGAEFGEPRLVRYGYQGAGDGTVDGIEGNGGSWRGHGSRWFWGFGYFAATLAASFGGLSAGVYSGTICCRIARHCVSSPLSAACCNSSIARAST